MSYEPTASDAVEGTTICLKCDAGNSWLYGQRPPVICRRCDEHIACVQCGEVCELDDDGRCAECVTPRVTYVDAVIDEFGLSLVKRERKAS